MSTAPDVTSWREGRSSTRTVGLVFLLYAVTRLASLDVLPIFLDEAVHIQWAERLYSEGRILRPVGSGRLLAVAAYGLALPFDDRLWAARFIAALAGAATLLFTVLLARKLFGERAALMAGSFYLVSPFALVYDRLALSDGFLCAAITGLMLATFEFSRNPHRSSRAWLAAAVFVALAIIAKVSALLFFVTVPLGVLTLASDRKEAFRSAARALAIGLAAASPMLWFFASNSGEISGQHIIDPENAMTLVASTLRYMRAWVLSYFTLPMVAAAILSMALLRDGRALWLAGSVLAPFLLFAAVAQPWSARYVLSTLPPLLILAAGGIDALARRAKTGKAAVALAVLASLSALSFDRSLLFDPPSAPFPDDDLRQLVTGWPAGYGLRDLSVRLRGEAVEGPITVFVDAGGLRTLPTSLGVLVGRDPRVTIIEGDFGSAGFRDRMTSEPRSRRAYAVAGPRAVAFEFGSMVSAGLAERLQVFSRPGGEWAATLFRLKSAP